MNNKGFAITTIIYSMVIVLSVIMILIFTSLKEEYKLEKNYTSDIKEELNECRKDGSCK